MDQETKNQVARHIILLGLMAMDNKEYGDKVEVYIKELAEMIGVSKELDYQLTFYYDRAVERNQ